jgi:ribosomal protein S18 acetylase RimI-like enzyme
MEIARTRLADIETLKSWFPDKEAGYAWGGPGLRFPFTHESFLEDMQWEKMPSYSLLDDSGQLGGFGQFYEKSGRCHLARLVVAPQLRGQGQGQWFIARLMETGMQQLGKNACSLFVIASNVRALKCYTALGFEKAAYPAEQQRFADIEFMVFNPA